MATVELERMPSSTRHFSDRPYRFSSDSSRCSTDGDSTWGTSAISHSRGVSVSSLYSLSRISFANQVSRLACVALPQQSSIEIIASTSSVKTLWKTLEEAAHDIQKWIRNATEVLQGLDAEDDIEWAAAAGREGVAQVDEAMLNFAGLIQAYMASVEQLQLRQDASSISKSNMSPLLDQLEDITCKWQDRSTKLQAIKQQVEISLEWEELQSGVLSEISAEIEQLTKLVFEMEERRHQTDDYGFGVAPSPTKTEDGTIDTRSRRRSVVPPTTATTPTAIPFAMTPNTHDGSQLISLFARMQPLRASLDFLPMRISTFQQRAEGSFPTACRELENRQQLLERLWEELELDAQALRKELGEDRWVVVFRNAAQQAVRMIESVHRSLSQVDEALDSNMRRSHGSMTTKKIDSYNAKKSHYCPAIERVLEILAKGAKDRTSVNGEVIRLQADARRRWESLRVSIQVLDSTLANYDTKRYDQSCSEDSISTCHERSRKNSAERVVPSSSNANSYLLPVSASRNQGLAPLHSSGSRPSLQARVSSMNVRDSSAGRSTLRARVSSINMGETLSRSHSREPLTPQSGLRASFLPVRIKEESFLSPTPQRGLARPRTPTSILASITPARPMQLMTPISTVTRPERPRWKSSTRVDYARKPDPPRVTGSKQLSTLTHQDSALDMNASYAHLSSRLAPMRQQTPLRSRSSRLTDIYSNSLLTPRSSSPATFSQSFYARPNYAQSPSYTKASISSTPLRARASMGLGRLASNYGNMTPVTPRSGTSIGVRSEYGMVTPASKPRWRA